MTPTETAREHVGNAAQLLVTAQERLVEAAGAKEEWVRQAVADAEELVVAAGVRLAQALLQMDGSAEPPYPPFPHGMG
jgi:hypothetical protein